LIVIAGATASGKTDLAIQLALQFQTEIISADARQFYREMNIGTAKPTASQLQKVKHHFINSLSIHDDYSAGKFRNDALQLLNNLFSKHKTVVMVGGSGLFIRAVLNGFDDIPEVSVEVKEKVKNIYEVKGIIGLQEHLKESDFDYYNEVDLQNPYRLMRALEICISSGQSFSSFRKGTKTQNNFYVNYFVSDVQKQELYNRINNRVDDMMKAGLLEEAKLLFEFRNLNALNTVGYKELFEHFDGKLSLETAIEKIKQHTRNYAKRQLTWYRKESEAQWKTAEEIITFNKI
ncbi:MAG: tRNA (adenosine(37)-N6)-dimethylallyltransferase MiaA, partial [Bacteroidota bacterium]